MLLKLLDFILITLKRYYVWIVLVFGRYQIWLYKPYAVCLIPLIGLIITYINYILYRCEKNNIKTIICKGEYEE